MKLYLASGTHYEKQADVPKGTKFEAVEFPFAASPKADFVAWLNALDDEGLAAPGPATPEFRLNPADYPVGIPTPNPVQPDPHFARQTIAFEDGFAAMPLPTQLHFAALAVENARKGIK